MAAPSCRVEVEARAEFTFYAEAEQLQLSDRDDGLKVLRGHNGGRRHGWPSIRRACVAGVEEDRPEHEMKAEMTLRKIIRGHRKSNESVLMLHARHHRPGAEAKGFR